MSRFEIVPLLVAALALALAKFTADRDNRGVRIPHGGYTWWAVLAVLAYLAMRAAQ